MSVPSALAAAVADRYRLDRELGQGGTAVALTLQFCQAVADLRQ